MKAPENNQSEEKTNWFYNTEVAMNLSELTLGVS